MHAGLFLPQRTKAKGNSFGVSGSRRMDHGPPKKLSLQPSKLTYPIHQPIHSSISPCLPNSSHFPDLRSPRMCAVACRAGEAALLPEPARELLGAERASGLGCHVATEFGICFLMGFEGRTKGNPRDYRGYLSYWMLSRLFLVKIQLAIETESDDLVQHI